MTANSYVVFQIEGVSVKKLEEILYEADAIGRYSKLLAQLHVTLICECTTYAQCIGKGSLLQDKWRQDVTERMEYWKNQAHKFTFLSVYSIYFNEE